mgnify:CR=1 FL=1
MNTITGACTNFFMTFGFLFLYLFSFLLNLATGDPTGASSLVVLFLFPILIIVLQEYLFFRYFPYETPKYLAEQHNREQLVLLLREFYKEEFV